MTRDGLTADAARAAYQAARDLPQAERVVAYAATLRAAFGDQPTHGQLAADEGVHAKTVQRARRRLEPAGAWPLQQHRGGRPRNGGQPPPETVDNIDGTTDALAGICPPKTVDSETVDNNLSRTGPLAHEARPTDGALSLEVNPHDNTNAAAKVDSVTVGLVLGQLREVGITGPARGELANRWKDHPDQVGAIITAAARSGVRSRAGWVRSVLERTEPGSYEVDPNHASGDWTDLVGETVDTTDTAAKPAGLPRGVPSNWRELTRQLRQAAGGPEAAAAPS